MTAGRLLFRGALFMVAALALSACSSGNGNASRADDNQGRGGGVALGGGSSSSGGGGDVAGIGVNSFLWRASLDTLNFMPLASAALR